MKKFLSLVLALAMAMSLVVINTSATDFTDDGDITYGEAVDVVSAIGIVDGYTDGSFNPQGGLTRGAAAKIICNLILGPTTAAELNATTAPYSDVSVNNEFAGYIAYCAQQGIISGYADGTFRPANPLTGYAFMKMLLGALGYDQYTEGYTGDNWSIQVAKQAIGIGLNAGLEGEFNGTNYVTREEAALYTLNTLQADMVAYDTVITTTINGQTVTIGNSVAKSREWGSSATRRNNIKNDIYVQFAEEYFNRLVKAEDVDDFGRPAYTWTYNSNEIGTYVDYSLLVDEFTTAVTGRDLYNTLTATTIRQNSLDVYIDGVSSSNHPAMFDATELVRGNTNTLGETGNGVLTQVFYDQDDELITIAIINTYLVKADTDYNERRDEVNFTVYGASTTTAGLTGEYVKKAGASGDTAAATVDSEDFAVVEDIQEGDIFLATLADGKVQSLADPEVIDEITLTSFRLGKSVTGGGETYDYNDSATYDPDVLDKYVDNNMKDTTYRLYLDQYGYMIGIEEVDAADNYVFIAGYETFGSVLSNATTEAFAIFTDGTEATITVKNAGTTANPTGGTWSGTSGNDNLNAWYTYSVDSNDRYSLTPVVTTLGTNDKAAQFQDSTNLKTIDRSHISLKDDGASVYAYGNDESVFIGADIGTVGTRNLIDGVVTVVTGVRNVNMEMTDTYENGSSGDPVGAYVLYDDDYYIIAAVVVAKNLASSENYGLVVSDVTQEDFDASTGEWTWYRTAIINGVETEVREKSDTNSSKLYSLPNTMQWVKFSYDADGYVIDAVPVASSAWKSGTITSSTELVNGVVDFNQKETGSYDKEDVILVAQGINPGWTNNGLTLQGLALYTGATTADLGINLLPDANAVVLTTDKDAVATPALATVYGNYDVDYYDSVSAAVNSLIDYNTAVAGINFTGQVWFVMENGVASSVIIRVDNPEQGYRPGPGGNSGALDVTGLAFSNTGMVVSLVNNTGVTLDATYVYTVTVRNADDVLVYTGNATAIGGSSIANNTNGTLTFGDYTAVASNTGNYTVTLTISNGTNTYTTTDVVGGI